MRYIGLDLALTTAHKALVMDDRGQALTVVMSVNTSAVALEQLFRRAREGAAEDEPLAVVMEPTGMAWFPVAVFCQRRGVKVYLVNSQQVADLRRYYRKHAKSDRIDARVLAKLPIVSPEKLHPLQLISATQLACQRGCKELNRLMDLSTAIQNRLRAIDRFAWPGLEQVLTDNAAPLTRWFRENWYDPRQVLTLGATGLQQAWQKSGLKSTEMLESADDWAAAIVQLAQEVLSLYGSEAEYLDYAYLQAEVTREQALLAMLETEHRRLQLKTVRPLYRQLHPSRNLESLHGVGQDGAAVYFSFVGNPERFPDHASFRGWSGMIPRSSQSGARESKGLHISQAGPDLVKKFSFMGAEAARQWDPQIAAIYYNQIVRHGKHHTQALCACATHLLDRIWTILKEDRPYELRDVDGTPVTVSQARQIIAERYIVPKEVRQRNNQRTRRARQEQRAEKKQKRESRPNQVRGKSQTSSE
ncbi:MAG: IS110 family transposase [Geobacter sp.]|nr:MAG: IS110 family transposase [Geobacter sp.]